MTVEQRLERIERTLNLLAKEKTGPAWVKLGAVYQATGWSNTQLRRFRESGVIKCRRKNGLEYDLNSIPAALLKNKTA